MGSSLNGFIKLHRKLVAWGWYQDYVVKDVFLHLLLTANFRDTQWMGVTLKKGQLVTSYKHLPVPQARARRSGDRVHGNRASRSYNFPQEGYTDRP